MQHKWRHLHHLKSWLPGQRVQFGKLNWICDDKLRYRIRSHSSNQTNGNTRSGDIGVSSCALTCYTGYNGSPTAACNTSGGTFTISSACQNSTSTITTGEVPSRKAMRQLCSIRSQPNFIGKNANGTHDATLQHIMRTLARTWARSMKHKPPPRHSGKVFGS